jgi:hypothetical protein
MCTYPHSRPSTAPEVRPPLRTARVAATVLAFVAPLLTQGSARAGLTGLQAMVLTSEMEGTAESLHRLVDLGLLPAGSPLSMTGTFSDSGGTMTTSGTVNGNPFLLIYSASLSGSVGQNITLSLTGSGTINSSSIMTSGSTIFNWDTSQNDYTSMDYADEITVYHVPSLYTLGSEVLSGAHGHWFLAIIEALVAIVQSVIDTGTSPPTPPVQGTLIADNSSINGSNNTMNENSGGVIIINSSYDSTAGLITGTVVVVPEPPSVVMLSMGALALLGFTWRRARLVAI